MKINPPARARHVLRVVRRRATGQRLILSHTTRAVEVIGSRILCVVISKLTGLLWDTSVHPLHNSRSKTALEKGLLSVTVAISCIDYNTIGKS